MNDNYIKREDAIKKIEKITTGDINTIITDEAKRKAAETLFADIPSADVVEVVRCKDCRFYNPYDATKAYDCEKGLLGVMQDDYCSCGERAE